MNDYYDLLARRRSVRKYDESAPLTQAELDEITAFLDTLTPLIDGIEVAFTLLKRTETNAKFGEYGIRMFSEKKPNYLVNAGFMLEQFDLFLASRGIGACWYGLAGRPKPSACPKGTAYVILIVFGRSDGELFRGDISEFNRRPQDELWTGDFAADVKEKALLAPSACNSQPWRIVSEKGILSVFRDPHNRSNVPRSFAPFFNSIDMGIFLCFLETALTHNGISFTRAVLEPEDGAKLIPIAEYTIK